MKLIVLGATGRAGTRIIDEALSRGHQVTGVSRSSGEAASHAGVIIHPADATSPNLPDLMRGHDAVISAMRFVNVPASTLIDAVKKAGVKRLLVVGGSGSLEVAPGVQLVDTPDLPEIYREEANAGRVFLNDLKHETELEWTFISPTATLDPGVRTGKYRLGGDQLMLDADGNSFISMEDYAIALIDEAEQGHHIRKRIQVGY